MRGSLDRQCLVLETDALAPSASADLVLIRTSRRRGWADAFRGSVPSEGAGYAVGCAPPGGYARSIGGGGWPGPGTGGSGSGGGSGCGPGPGVRPARALVGRHDRGCRLSGLRDARGLPWLSRSPGLGRGRRRRLLRFGHLIGLLRFARVAWSLGDSLNGIGLGHTLVTGNRAQRGAPVRVPGSLVTPLDRGTDLLAAHPIANTLWRMAGNS
jgi:hypothetical protein